MCLLICSLREEDWLHEKSDCVHLCCFSPVWMREWVFKLHFNQMTCYTCGQLNFLTQLWVCLWLKKLPLFANVFGHTLQDICFVIFKYHLLIRLVFSSDCHKRQLSLLSWNKDIRLDYVSRYYTVTTLNNLLGFCWLGEMMIIFVASDLYFTISK